MILAHDVPMEGGPFQGDTGDSPTSFPIQVTDAQGRILRIEALESSVLEKLGQIEAHVQNTIDRLDSMVKRSSTSI